MFGSPSFGNRSAKTTPTLRAPLAMEALEARDVPAVFANDDTYTVEAGRNLVIEAFRPDPVTGQLGVLANDFSDSTFNAILVSEQLSPAKSVNQPAPALPNGSLTFNSNGSFTFIAPSNYDAQQFGNIQFQYRAIDTRTNQVSTPATVTITITSPIGAQKLFAVGAGPGAAPTIRVFEASSGVQRYQFNAYEPSFTGGVRVTTGDLNRDGVDDIVTVPSTGGSARVRVFDGKTGAILEDFFSFEAEFRGGGEVAIGDIQGDGFNDIIVGAGNAGGPRVTIFDGSLVGTGNFIGTQIANFFAYEDTFRNGVRVAAGNLDGLTGINRRDYLVTGAGEGGGPAVNIYDGRRAIGSTNPVALRSFFAFDVNTRSGVSVAVGQFRGDGKADIVAGTGSGTALVRVFDGRNNAQLREITVPTIDGPTGGISGTPSGQASASGGSINFGGQNTGGSLIATNNGAGGAGGVRVAVTDRNGDGLSDILTGPGSGTVPRIRIFDGSSLQEIANDLVFANNFLGGVFVGGNSLNQ